MRLCHFSFLVTPIHQSSSSYRATFARPELDSELFIKKLNARYAAVHNPEDVDKNNLRLEASDGTGFILAEPEGFTFTVDAPYPDWTSVLEPEISTLLNCFSQSAKSDRITSFELQYVNFLALPIAADKLHEYFSIVRMPSLSASFNGINLGQRLELPRLDSLDVQMRFADLKIPAEFSCQLQHSKANVDCYELINTGSWSTKLDNRSVTISTALSRLPHLKDVLYLLFNAIVTDQCRALFDKPNEP